MRNNQLLQGCKRRDELGRNMFFIFTRILVSQMHGCNWGNGFNSFFAMRLASSGRFAWCRRFNQQERNCTHVQRSGGNSASSWKKKQCSPCIPIFYIVFISTASLQGGFKPGTRFVLFRQEEQEHSIMHKFQDKKTCTPSRGIPEVDRFLASLWLTFNVGMIPTRALESFSPRCASSSSSSSSELWPCQNIHSSLYLLFLRAVSKTASSRKESIVALASPTNLGSCWILNAWWNGNPSWKPKMRKGMAVNPGDEHQDQMANGNQKWIDWTDVTVVFGGQWGQRKRRSSWCQCIFSLEWQGHLEFGQLCSAANVQGRELKWVENVTAV